MIFKQLSRGLVAAVLLVAFGTHAFAEGDSVLDYPETQTGDVVDDYHGTEVEDPYRWLEDQYADEVAEWVTAQNEVTFAYLEKLPMRESLEERLTELWDYAKMGTPWRVADRYFFTRNDGLQNQSVLFVQEGLDGDPRVDHSDEPRARRDQA